MCISKSSNCSVPSIISFYLDPNVFLSEPTFEVAVTRKYTFHLPVNESSGAFRNVVCRAWIHYAIHDVTDVEFSFQIKEICHCISNWGEAWGSTVTRSPSKRQKEPEPSLLIHTQEQNHCCNLISCESQVENSSLKSYKPEMLPGERGPDLKVVPRSLGT